MAAGRQLEGAGVRGGDHLAAHLRPWGVCGLHLVPQGIAEMKIVKPAQSLTTRALVLRKVPKRGEADHSCQTFPRPESVAARLVRNREY